ncbi:MAG: MaoC family dehydratase N-terminal domain-containing protein [Candidatus Dormiibacterota bacterium]
MDQAAPPAGPTDRLMDTGAPLTTPFAEDRRAEALTILGAAMAFNFDCAGKRYRGQPEILDRARHQAYAEAVGAPPASEDGFTRPLACFAAVYLLWPVVPQLFQDPEVGLDVEHLLHGEQEFTFERPLLFDETITPVGVIEKVDRRRGMVFLDFRCEGVDRVNQVAARSRSLFVVRESG